jgi:hypothetical protein
MAGMSDSQSMLQVFISMRDSTCGECEEELGRKAWITLNKQKGALCLSCADIDHLVFLPTGDATLTRRSRKYSRLCAVVLKWSRARNRYERQGLLVEESALEKAEQECLSDEEFRARRREREAIRRSELDRQYVEAFCKASARTFPWMSSRSRNQGSRARLSKIQRPNWLFCSGQTI